MLFSIVKDPTTSTDELNHDLQTISEWAHQWKLEFNPDPSKQATELLCTQKKYRTYHSPLLFNGNEMSKVNEHKHPGLILDTKLSFEKHINEKIIKAKKIIGIINYFSNYLPTKTFDLMNKLCVRACVRACTRALSRFLSASNRDLWDVHVPEIHKGLYKNKDSNTRSWNRSDSTF